MSSIGDYEALVKRLRAELAKAEQTFRYATTPESKAEARDRFEQALSRFSDLLLRKPPRP